jgi:alcohol dehydrogenase (cytochrome c)
LQNTRDVASPIASSNVSNLGVAWCVLLAAAPLFGDYATTPVVVDGVVYTQDLLSNVIAIDLATGRVLWKHTYNSQNGGPGRRQRGARDRVRGHGHRRRRP